MGFWLIVWVNMTTGVSIGEDTLLGSITVGNELTGSVTVGNELTGEVTSWPS